MKNIHLHLVSDSTGETVSMVARACLAQFEDVVAENHNWTLVRETDQLDEIITSIEENRGFVKRGSAVSHGYVSYKQASYYSGLGWQSKSTIS